MNSKNCIIIEKAVLFTKVEISLLDKMAFKPAANLVEFAELNDLEFLKESDEWYNVEIVRNDSFSLEVSGNSILVTDLLKTGKFNLQVLMLEFPSKFK